MGSITLSKYHKIGLYLAFGIAAAVVVGVIGYNFRYDEQLQACQKLGMPDVVEQGRIVFCVDAEGHRYNLKALKLLH